MQEATCYRCGEHKPVDEFAPDKCKASGHASICRPCDRAKSREYYYANRAKKLAYAKARNAAKPKRVPPERPCAECGKPYRHPHPLVKVCGEDCRLDRQGKRDRHERTIAVQCAHCGRTCYRKPWDLQRYPTSYCSKRCAGQAIALARGETLKPSTELVGPVPRRALNIIIVPGRTVARRRFISGPCLASCCNETVVSTDWKARFCSTSCARREYRHNRKHRERSATKAKRVYRRRVFERDDWTCRLCRKRLKVDAEVPNPRAPTIDHILPLSLGGQHTYENVQAACFKCNSRKGNRVTQLALGM